MTRLCALLAEVTALRAELAALRVDQAAVRRAEDLAWQRWLAAIIDATPEQEHPA